MYRIAPQDKASIRKYIPNLMGSPVHLVRTEVGEADKLPIQGRIGKLHKSIQRELGGSVSEK